MRSNHTACRFAEKALFLRTVLAVRRWAPRVPPCSMAKRSSVKYTPSCGPSLFSSGWQRGRTMPAALRKIEGNDFYPMKRDLESFLSICCSRTVRDLERLTQKQNITFIGHWSVPGKNRAGRIPIGSDTCGAV